MSRVPEKLLAAGSVRATITNSFVSAWCDTTGWSIQLHLEQGGRELLKELGLPDPPRDGGRKIAETENVNVRIAGNDTEAI